jgi:hypothetical protein
VCELPAPPDDTDDALAAAALAALGDLAAPIDTPPVDPPLSSDEPPHPDTDSASAVRLTDRTASRNLRIGITFSHASNCLGYSGAG